MSVPFDLKPLSFRSIGQDRRPLVSFYEGPISTGTN